MGNFVPKDVYVIEVRADNYFKRKKMTLISGIQSFMQLHRPPLKIRSRNAPLNDLSWLACGSPNSVARCRARLSWTHRFIPWTSLAGHANDFVEPQGLRT